MAKEYCIKEDKSMKELGKEELAMEI